VPPAGKVWVNDRWQRDDRGWYRIPGSWSDERDDADVTDWRESGPPADRPQETVGPAPGPGAFYIPGIYVPKGDRVSWRPGYWAAPQAGWEWIPARWVRLAEGFDYREGYWNRVNNERSQPAPADRHVVARPTSATTPRQSANGPTDLEPIPDRDLTRASAEPGALRPVPSPSADDRPVQVQPDAGRPAQVQPDADLTAEVPQPPANSPAVIDPRLTGPAPVVIRPGLPIPYWDGGRLVVPPTRYGAGVVVDPSGGFIGNPYPAIGILPPRASGPIVVPRGGILGGRVRGLFGR